MKLRLKELQLHDPSLDLARAKLDADAKKAILEQAEYARGECRLLAPVDGTVLRVLANTGDLTGPQTKQPALFFCRGRAPHRSRRRGTGIRRSSCGGPDSDDPG